MRVVIGVAGTAKNTGKTTTLQAIAAYLRSKGVPVLLTSIGYDGEDVDTITALPKPKMSVEEGDWVATALPFMNTSTAIFKDVRYTGVECALGPVYLGMAASPGRVILAGPASTFDIERILGVFPEWCTVLVDGAFSRFSPMSVATHIVFATGAARYQDPMLIAAEIRAISSVMAIPRGFSEGRSLQFPEGLYLDGSDLRFVEAVESEPHIEVVTAFVCGPINPRILRQALGMLGKSGRRVKVVVRHPVDLLLSGNITEWPMVFEESLTHGNLIACQRSSRLLGFTVNPRFPAFDSATGRYTSILLPQQWFLESIRSASGADCTDIVFEGPSVLDAWLCEVRAEPV